MTMPCRPSKPPVMSEKRLASSRSNSAMPSVTISRVRSAPRMTRNEVTKPTTIAARPATSSASTGSSTIVMQRQQAGRVGADAEERRMAERDDAGIAEDQVEREHEQRQPGDLGQDQVAVRKQQDRDQRQRPEQHLAPAPARQVVRWQRQCRCGRARACQRVAVLPNKPFGRRIRITIIMV